MKQVVLPAEAAKLLDQHPCLRAAYDEALRVADGAPLNIYVNTEMAAAETLYLQPDRDRGPRFDGELRSRRTQSLRPVHHDGRPGRARDWGWNGGNLHYVYKLFDGPIRDWDYGAEQDPFEAIGSIMLVAIDRWQRGLAPVERVDLTLTLLLAPSQGWRRLYSWADLRNVKLSAELVTGGPHAVTLRDVLGRLAMKFDDDVWDRGLAEMVASGFGQSSEPGVRGYGWVRLEVSTQAGQLHIGLVDDGRRFALIRSANNRWQPECNGTATLTEIIGMVETVCSGWHFVE
jgi:hypothetical protein